MTNTGALFVAAAMAVTAVCVGVIVFFGFGAGMPAAILSAGGALGAMALTHLAFARAPSPDFGRLEELDRAVSDLQSRIERLEGRLTTLDAQSVERAKAAVKPLIAELTSLGGIVTSVAKEVAGHDARLAELASREALRDAAEIPAPPTTPPLPAPPTQAPPPAETPRAKAEPRPEPAARRAPAAAAEPFDPDAPEPAVAEPQGKPEAGIVRRALREGRVDIHLQPIVALPSRRTLHYEAFARIASGEAVVEARDFAAEAAEERAIAAIDRIVLDKASLVAQRLAASGRQGVVFVNVSDQSLADDAFVGAMRDGLARAPELAGLLALEFRHAAFAAMGPAERTILSGFVERGVRISVDQVETLRIDGRALAQRGVRFAKIRAALLLEQAAAAATPIHAADLSGLLAREGVQLIATHVEDERTPPELLDLEISAAQGFLFGAARPVRPPSEPRPQPRDLSAAPRLVPRTLATR